MTIFITVFALLCFIWLIWLIRRGLRACIAAHEADWGIPWVNYLDGMNRIFSKRFHRLEYNPVDLPATGPAIVVANHLSGLDPILLFAATRRPLRFLIAREEYERFGFQWIFRTGGCIPVDRATKPEAALRVALRALQAGEVIALFPQGTITLPDQLPRKLKRGCLWLAQQTNAPIYPVHLSGIKGMGHTISALFMRSHAKLTSYPPLIGDAIDLDYLQALLEGRIELTKTD